MAVPSALQQPVDLDVFQGPFDLLLTLVLREEVDLFELPLVELIHGALGERAVERWDLETASELVVLLSSLAELKARLLLGEPGEAEPDPDAVEARERLAARLIAYAPFQRAAEWLAERAGECAGPRYRRVPLPGMPPPAPAPESPSSLAGALGPLLVAPPAPSLTHLTSRRVHLPALLDRLRDALHRVRHVSFDEMVGDAPPLEEAMMLLAALELARRGEARLDQPVAFGDIAITATGGR
ncbi:MAG: segregation/condensation protein A [Actinomycetota bacterium]